MIVNTSRGALIDTEALIDGLKRRRIGAACLDVYEEESDLFYEDRSDSIIEDDVLVRLISMPNVIVTSHQAVLTREALNNIAAATVVNLLKFKRGEAAPDPGSATAAHRRASTICKTALALPARSFQFSRVSSIAHAITKNGVDRHMEIPKNACTQYPSTALPQMRAAGRSPALRTKRTAEQPSAPSQQSRAKRAPDLQDVQILVVRRIDPSTAYNVSGFVVPLKIRRNTAGQRIRAPPNSGRSFTACQTFFQI